MNNFDIKTEINILNRIKELENTTNILQFKIELDNKNTKNILISLNKLNIKINTFTDVCNDLLKMIARYEKTIELYEKTNKTMFNYMLKQCKNE